MLFVLFAFYFSQDQNIHVSSGLFARSMDTDGYYLPLINLAEGHGYGIYNDEAGQFTPLAIRMPGLVPLYLPLHWMFGSGVALAGMILLQSLGSLLAIWLMGRIAWFLKPNVLFAGGTMFLFAASSYIGVYDHYGLSESLNLSTFIIAIYYFTRYLDSRLLKHVFLAGLFLGWSLFIRPVVGYFLVMLPLIKLLMDLRQGQFQWAESFKSMLLFALMPVIFLSVWSVRNYSAFDKFIPLQMSITEAMPNAYTPHRLACLDLILAMGQSTVDFSNHTMGDWFFDDSYEGEFDLSVIPETSVYNSDSILALREQYLLLRFHQVQGEEASALSEVVTDKAKRYQASLKSEKPLFYYLIAKVKLIGHFIFHKKLISPFPFPALSEMSVIQMGVKAFNLLLINLVAILGLIGVILSFVGGNLRQRLYAILPLSFMIVLPVLVGYLEQRYFAHVYILLLPMVMVVVDWVIRLVSRKTT